MAGRRGRSGPPGNLHGTRHPWRSFWRRRALRAQDRWVLTILRDYREALAGDRPDSTAGEQAVIQIAETARGCTALILSEAAQRGLIRELEGGAWDLQPGLRELSRFLAVELRALQTLGLDRRAKPLPSLAEYIAGRKS